MSTASTSTAQYAGGAVPPTQLPVDPHTLTRYLRSRQLAALRGLYDYKTLAVTQQIEQHAASLRGRHGRARRRRGSSPLEERDLEAEDDEDDLEVRKRMRYDPAADDYDTAQQKANHRTDGDESSSTPAAATASGTSTPVVPGTRASSQRAFVPPTSSVRDRLPGDSTVDPAHVYDYVFDLAPDSSSDAYYHGAHPPPPARVVRTVLRATQKKPFVDPAGLSTAQLEALTTKLWDEEGKGLSIFFGESGGSASQKRRGDQPLSRDQERYQREVNAEAADEWELSVIAGFSARCDEQIGTSLARKPMTAREMQAQAQAQAQAHAQAQAQLQARPATHASQPGSLPPITSAAPAPSQASPATSLPHHHQSQPTPSHLAHPAAPMPVQQQQQQQQQQQHQQPTSLAHMLPGYRGPSLGQPFGGSGTSVGGGMATEYTKTDQRYGSAGPGSAAGWRW